MTSYNFPFNFQSENGPILMSYLPWYYENSFVMFQLMDTEGKEIDDLKAQIKATLDQFFAERATFTLAQWESELKLPVRTDLTDAERRSNILAQIRGYGSANITLVRTVANSYDNGEVEVIEDFDNFKIIIRFVSQKGIPSNLEDLKKALEKILPAHLQVEYQFTYLLWYELEDAGVTWDRIETEGGDGLTWDKLEIWIP